MRSWNCYLAIATMSPTPPPRVITQLITHPMLNLSVGNRHTCSKTNIYRETLLSYPSIHKDLTKTFEAEKNYTSIYCRKNKNKTKVWGKWLLINQGWMLDCHLPPIEHHEENFQQEMHSFWFQSTKTAKHQCTNSLHSKRMTY